MKDKQHYYAGICVILCMGILPSSFGWSAQPMPESTLALQTGLATSTLPNIIFKANQDALQPEQERWRIQRALSDRFLREVRISMLEDGSLSPYEEQKKNTVSDSRDKKRASLKPHRESPDRFMVYEFESTNIHGEITITVK
ncbi:hypothetical protein [Acinetobacter haemolyticus]|uniref:hypothetical protein n=1 Tax=Acinetobacter haemolyticus TaxID=29430 RepID=UPI000D69F302|nr:hypothetical protein [Acinetobacter haemolyticus]